MTEDGISIIYLGLLLLAVAAGLIAEFRANPGGLLRQMGLWVMIFAGALAISGLWPMIRQTLSPHQSSDGQGRIAVPLGPDGHYHLRATLDGVPIRFVVDTGASDIVLSPRDARKLGINPDNLAYIHTAQTAGGPVRTAPVVITDFVLETIHDKNVPASVIETEMGTSLLGMSYLSRFARLSIEGDKLVMER